MKVLVETTADTLVLKLSDSFTFSDHNYFRRILDTIKKTDKKSIRLDVERVTFIDSAALGMLLLAREEAQKIKASIRIVGARDQVRRLFEIARVDQLFALDSGS